MIQPNAFINGDCLELLPDVQDSSVDLILVDPPYGSLRSLEWDSVIPLDKLWEHYKRILKPKGTIAICSQGIFTAALMMSNPEWYRYKWVWHKNRPTNHLNANRQPMRAYEEICIFAEQLGNYNPQLTEGKPYHTVSKPNADSVYLSYAQTETVNEGTRHPTDIIDGIKVTTPAKRIHPTEKPVALGEYLVKTYTNEGDLVLDHCAGSGSFLVAAQNLRRDYIGFEKDADYYEAAKRRLEADMFGNEN